MSNGNEVKKGPIKRKWKTSPDNDWARLGLELKERQTASMDEIRREALLLAGEGRVVGQVVRSLAKAHGTALNQGSHHIL